MPQVSETLDKLSDSLAELSGRALVAEKRAADARSETREQLDARAVDLNHDAKGAQRRADRAEDNAAEAIDFALYAVDEAEASVLDATDARMIADALA